MNTKKRFPPAAVIPGGLFLVLFSLFFLAGCDLQDWSRDLFHDTESSPPLPAKFIPVAGRTFTVLNAAPAVHNGANGVTESPPSYPYIRADIHLNTTTDVITIDEGAIKTYDNTSVHHSQLKALLLCAGWQQGDTFTFGRVNPYSGEFVDAEQVAFITKAAGGSSFISIVLSSDLPPGFFSQAPTFTGNPTYGVNISGLMPTDLSVFTLKSISNTAMYNFYGVEVTPKAVQTLAAMLVPNVVHLTPGPRENPTAGRNTTAVVLASGNPALYRLDISGGPLLITNHKAPVSGANFIVNLRGMNPGVSEATVSADVATTVNIDWQYEPTWGAPEGGPVYRKNKWVDLTATAASVVFTVSGAALAAGNNYVSSGGGLGAADSAASTITIYSASAGSITAVTPANRTDFKVTLTSGQTSRITRAVD
jgi:hypothetical protein